MTDQKPAIATAVEDSLNNLAEAFRVSWDKIRPVLEAVRRDGEAQTAAQYALAALWDEDDDQARGHLNDLDTDQLRDVENAAVALSLHASRLRNDPKETR